MKHLLLTTIAAVVLVGCGPSAPDISIHEAAKAGDIEAVKQHLAAGADLNAKNIDGWTPLHKAAQKGHKEVAELLIAGGADVNAKDRDGETPLHRVAIWGHKEVAELLIAKGADVNAMSGDGTPLDMTAGGDEEPDNKEIADLLRKHGGKMGAEFKAEGS